MASPSASPSFDLFQEFPPIMSDGVAGPGHNNPPAETGAPRKRGQPALPAGPAPIGFSSTFDKIAAAMLKVQKRIYMPPRNKTAVIVPRNRPEYTFSYTSLDVILELLKDPLVDNGLLLTTLYAQGEKAPVIIIRVLHAPSSQYIQSDVSIPPHEQGVQGMGSAATYLRRYAICAMFSIASDEDTDAAEAVNNGAYMLPASAEQAERLVGQQASLRHEKLISACNGATTPQSLLRMMQAWDAGQLQWMNYRDSPEHEGEWAVVFDLTATAIGRVHGMALAEVWRQMLQCVTREQLDRLRALWEEPAVVEGKRAMRASNPEAFKRFNAALVQVARRVETQPPPPAAPAEVIPFKDPGGGASTAAVDAPAEAVTALPTLPEAVDAQPAAEPEGDGPCVFDEGADPVDEPYRDRAQWITVYAELHREAADPAAVEAANAAGLIWACADRAHGALLQSLLAAPRAMERPPLIEREQRSSQDLLVPIREKRGGGLDYQSYLNDVQNALTQVDARELLPWIEVNRATYAGAGFSTVIRLKVLALVAKRAAALGVDLS